MIPFRPAQGPQSVKRPEEGCLSAGIRGPAECLVPRGVREEQFQSPQYLQDRGRPVAQGPQSVKCPEKGCLSLGPRGRTVRRVCGRVAWSPGGSQGGLSGPRPRHGRPVKAASL